MFAIGLLVSTSMPTLMHVRSQPQMIENKAGRKVRPWFSATSAGVFQPTGRIPTQLPEHFNQAASFRRWPEHKGAALVYAQKIHRPRAPGLRNQRRKKLRKELWKGRFSFDARKSAGA
jgi:hypothetical protein